MQIFLLDFFNLTDSESICLSPTEKTLISVARLSLGRNFRSGPTVLHVELNNNARWSGHCKVLIQGCLLLFYYSHAAIFPPTPSGLPAGTEYANTTTLTGLFGFLSICW